jgi:hypothetical protein
MLSARRIKNFLTNREREEAEHAICKGLIREMQGLMQIQAVGARQTVCANLLPQVTMFQVCRG